MMTRNANKWKNDMTTKRKNTNDDRTYTTRDLCDHFNMNAKSLRRKMRANDLRVGKGQRHTFTRTQYERVIAKLTNKQ